VKIGIEKQVINKLCTRPIGLRDRKNRKNFKRSRVIISGRREKKDYNIEEKRRKNAHDLGVNNSPT